MSTAFPIADITTENFELVPAPEENKPFMLLMKLSNASFTATLTNAALTLKSSTIDLKPAAIEDILEDTLILKSSNIFIKPGANALK